MNQILKDAKLVHVCIVTDDIDKTKGKLAEWLGIAAPETVVVPVWDVKYDGEPSKLGCRQMGFQIGNFMVEIIEPNEEPSAWNDYLKKNGPGLHHLAFEVSNLEKVTEDFKKEGVRVVQSGCFEGGSYIYVEALDQIGTYLEIMQMD